MAFGEPRLDRADDISAVFSRVKERIAIVAARQRISLTRRDEIELSEAFQDLDWLHEQVLILRAAVSAEYQDRIKKKRDAA